MNVIGENLLLIFVAAFFGQGKLGGWDKREDNCACFVYVLGLLHQRAFLSYWRCL